MVNFKNIYWGQELSVIFKTVLRPMFNIKFQFYGLRIWNEDD
jgi:hypothetical protein